MGEGWRASLKSGDKATARSLLGLGVSIPGVADAALIEAWSLELKIKEGEPGDRYFNKIEFILNYI